MKYPTDKVEPEMNSFKACAIIEGFDPDPHTEEEHIAAWQHLINTGDVWALQGFYGRTAKALIESGVCSAPEKGEQVNIIG